MSWNWKNEASIEAWCKVANQKWNDLHIHKHKMVDGMFVAAARTMRLPSSEKVIVCFSLVVLFILSNSVKNPPRKDHMLALSVTFGFFVSDCAIFCNSG